MVKAWSPPGHLLDFLVFTMVFKRHEKGVNIHDNSASIPLQPDDQDVKICDTAVRIFLSLPWFEFDEAAKRRHY